MSPTDGEDAVTHPDNGHETPTPPGQLFLSDLVEFCARRRRLLATAVLTGVVVTFALRALAPERYTATATILPQETERSAGLLGALAAQTGILLGTGAGNEEIFGRIVESRTVLMPLVERRWSHRDHARPVPLATVFGVDVSDAGSLDRQAEHRLLWTLRERVIDFERDLNTGFMALHVTMPGDPDLAAEFANALVKILEEFNDTDRFNRARNQREMIEARLAEVEADLETSSTALSAFVENNRAYASSPALTMEYARLEREVSADGLVWQELKRQLEIARIDELRNTVTVDVLDLATPPVDPDRPGLVFTAFVGIVLGCLAALVIVALTTVVGSFRARSRG